MHPRGDFIRTPEEAGEEKREAKRDAVDSVNATMLLVVVTVLVVGFYLFTLKPREDVTGAVAPLHMVVCVVSFILYACVERWWSMQLDTNPDAASICNLMALNKIAVAALGCSASASMWTMSSWAAGSMWRPWRLSAWQ